MQTINLILDMDVGGLGVINVVLNSVDNTIILTMDKELVKNSTTTPNAVKQILNLNNRTIVLADTIVIVINGGDKKKIHLF